MENFEQYVAYWTTEPGWRTELQLRNNLDPGELTVTAALRTADGAETALPPVTIKSGDVASLDLSDALLKTAPKLIGVWGSLVLRYRATVHHALYAAVMLRAEGRPIAFHLDAFFQSIQFAAGSREGIWWLPRESVTDYLILTNASGQRLDSRVVLYDARGKASNQKIRLAARETNRLSIRSLLRQAGLTGSYGGFKIEMAQGAGNLDSTHLLFDELTGFSAVMKMFRHDPSTTLFSRSFGGVKEWTTRAPMLALSEPDPALRFPAGTILQPKVFVRNASGKALTAHIRFNWRSETSSGKSAPLALAFKPNETQVVDVAALQAQKALPGDAHWAAVILSGPIQPDELLAVAASYDPTGRYGAQTPFSDQLASHWEAGKWEVDAVHDSLVTIGNGGNRPERAQLTILYNEGKGQYQVEQMLAPDEQTMLDFGKLIRDQIPDKDGRTLPLDLASGTYRLRDLTDSAAGGLYEGKVIVDKTYGHAAYGCMICCGPEYPTMEFDPINLIIQAYESQVIQAPNSCGGGVQNVTLDFPTWWTDNSLIATANNAKITGVRVGSTNHHAQSKPMYWGFRKNASSCPQSQPEPSADTNVCNNPSTASSILKDPLNLSSVYPNLLSGIGNVAAVTVGPSGTTWNGQSVTETVTTGGTNTCPSGFPTNVCSGGTTFIVGQGYQPVVKEGSNTVPVGPLLVGTPNEFFDQYSVTSNVSLLDQYGGGNSCQISCSQTYSNSCTTPQPILNHTFTYTFTKSTISGTKVTLVTVSE
ncbi:MAG TPA: hypothetical protein VMQ17_22020 [Candidatus Sulfotelmatobacter sp.]|nr:hypothetical protein [Candidatus Sulfotelmatobacter sp.]